jgi:hypothetical protein
MHRDDRGQRRWRRREQNVELWGRPIERSDWRRGTYGPPEFERSRGRGPAWDRGEDWGSRASEWDRGDWDRGDWDRQDRGGWQRSPNYEWQGQQSDWSGPSHWSTRQPPISDWDEGTTRGPWAGQAYADNWTEPRTGAATQRHWHGRTVMKGFERTDERIREEVCQRMCEHPAIDTAEMQVTVQNGEVTLEGSVDDRFEKRLAEDLAEDVPGVRDVHNRLRTGGHERMSTSSGNGHFERERVGTEHDAA